MHIILSRHGNTFNSSSDAAWVGGSNDLSLVEQGRIQAETCGHALQQSDITLSHIYAAPLKRTAEYAEIVKNLQNSSVSITKEERLREIDYGNWAGKSNQQIISEYGESELIKWQEDGIWPESGQWSPSEADIMKGIQDLTVDIINRYKENEAILIVSSNGILRYFLSMIEGVYEQLKQDKRLKVKTGNVCILSANANEITLKAWNIHPNELKL